MDCVTTHPRLWSLTPDYTCVCFYWIGETFIELGAQYENKHDCYLQPDANDWLTQISLQQARLGDVQ